MRTNPDIVFGFSIGISVSGFMEALWNHTIVFAFVWPLFIVLVLTTRQWSKKSFLRDSHF